VDEPRIVIGAWLADGDTGTTGAAYFYRASLSDWQFGEKRFLSNGEYGDGFGNAVSISGDCAIIGAVNDDASDAENVGAAYIYCNLPGAVAPAFELDIICCVEIPDPLGPVVAATRILNPGEAVRLGRRWVEWIDPDGATTIVAGPESIAVSPGETRDERHPLPQAVRRGGRLVLYWQDEHGMRTAVATLEFR
jgi:hypothetical protein